MSVEHGTWFLAVQLETVVFTFKTLHTMAILTLMSSFSQHVICCPLQTAGVRGNRGCGVCGRHCLFSETFHGCLPSFCSPGCPGWTVGEVRKTQKRGKKKREGERERKIEYVSVLPVDWWCSMEKLFLLSRSSG